MDSEFKRLADQLQHSGCDKKQTACGTYVGVSFHTAVNYCKHDGDVCPRLNLPSGQGYELCQAKHAEANLADKIKAINMQSNGIAWLVGHYWVCEPCATALKSIGVVEVRFREHV